MVIVGIDPGLSGGKWLRIKIPGSPIALKRHRTFNKGKFKGSYDPSSVDKADFLAKIISIAPAKPIDGPLIVKMKFFFKRPNNHYKTGKNKDQLKINAPNEHVSRPDIDNLVKFVADALNGVIWVDDSCISTLIATKRYSEIPCVLLEIKHRT